MIARKGFTLIEVLVVIGLVSMLLTGLFSSFLAGNRITQAIDDEINMYDAVILIDRQVARDLAGAFIPTQAEQPKKQAAQPAQGKQGQTPPPQAQPAAQETKKKSLQDPFIAKNQAEEIMSTLSFITNNPMRVYWSESSGKPIPSVVRVYYTLQADKNASKEKPRYTLYRQEGTNLDIAAYGSSDSAIERYPLVENIKRCSLEFVAEKEEEPQKGQKKEKGKKETKTFKDWVVADAEDMRAKVKLPTRVTMRLEIWDTVQEKSRDFVLVYPIAAPYREPEEPKQQAAPPTPAAPAGAPQPGAKAAPAKPGAPARTTMAQRTKNQQLLEGAQSVIDGLKAMFGDPRARG
jgi:prepilin-type N-terminal cleavage/methylation domain-containing protein